jgi:2-methylcitrate dehydratase PrpD
MEGITRQLARFAAETKWEDLPRPIVKETKLILMDTIGCGLGALSTEKGKMNVALAKRYGGPPESSIIGVGDKVACSNAAFANGELFITLDYSNIMAGGHDGVYILPTILAIAENIGASGKDLILASAIGFEISARLARAVGRHNITPEAVQRQRTAQPGLMGNAYSNFGAAAGAGRLLKLSEDKLLQALGVAGHLCMVLSYSRWGFGKDRYMAKYAVPGWQSTGAVAATLLAEMGYTGDTTVLDDPEHGFANFVGFKNWYPDEILDSLGKSWCFDFRLHYKPYPCCAIFHGILDCFCDLIEKNHLIPGEIESVTVYGRGGMNEGLFGRKEVDTISAAQFNPRYNIAVAAHRIPVGVDWIQPQIMTNPEILKFMDKITGYSHPDYLKILESDPLSSLSKVDVVARGRTFTVERKYRRGTTGTPARLTDDEIIAKFRHNAERILPAPKAKQVVNDFLDLENVENVSCLIRNITN